MVHKITLIPDWKRAWKYASVHFQAAGLLLMAAAEMLGDTWNALPPGLQQRLPHASTLALILFGLGLVSRVLTHEAKSDASN